jgi:hypothetical protein
MTTNPKINPFAVCIILAIPTSILAFYGYKHGYYAFQSFWSVRLIAFGVSYLVFPIMTWVFLSETPFKLSTIICIVLSIAIVAIQLFWPK